MTLAQIRGERTRNEARVSDLLAWKDGEYTVFLWNSGLSYLSHYIGTKDPDAIRMLQGRKEFWNWWKMIHHGIDSGFVEEWDGLEGTVPIIDLRQMYRDLHDPKMLASEICPPKEVYGSDFVTIKMEAV
ncbi:MAG: hypothetical protein J0M30_14665 [Chitinophagales bacterium]|nr:hypothetical protein [Chitinophagales bacterium]